MSAEIEIIHDPSAEHPFAVMVWGRNRDSGYLAGDFATRQRAIGFAEGMARAFSLNLQVADVVPLSGGAAP